jgi:hypothetical protein
MLCGIGRELWPIEIAIESIENKEGGFITAKENDRRI